MRYTKPPLDFEQQAELLISRGLIVDNKEELVYFLTNVNYYRLSGYLYTFKMIDPITNNECFLPNTHFSIVKQRYDFDRQLRILLLDAIEKIEVAILRTRLVELHSTRYGAFGYTLSSNYSFNFSKVDFVKLLNEIQLDENRSHENFIIRYRQKYFEEKNLPIWMAAEIMSFGQLFTLFRNSENVLKKDIASQFGLHLTVFDSWLHTMNYIRNACAHHVRLWNRKLPIAPYLPDRKNDPNWYSPVMISNQTIFAGLTLIRYLLIKIDPKNHWNQALIELLEKNPEIPIRMMGIPANWKECKYWKV
jgi:abortive infection bacteriophage resistance protein